MNRIIIIIIFSTFFNAIGFSQEKDSTNKDGILAETAGNACKCIDSISVYNKSKEDIAKEVNECIDSQTAAYQLGSKLMSISNLEKNAKGKDGKKVINISFTTDKTSAEYKEYYYKLERYIMLNCKSLKEKMSSNDKQNTKSLSKNQTAMDFYTKGLDESKNEKYEKAIEYFEKAINIDAEFAFAWDNMGLCFRKLNNYDKSLEAYKKSLEIDPKGIMPLQNIAIVYQYKQEYQNAIDSYERLIEIDKNNPEIYYGIGQVYATNLQDFEKGLTYMCKAYNLYIEQKSPYRTDAESIIKIIYSEMKKLGKENKFDEILKANNITAK